MNYLKISNKGEINPKAITLLGASTKRGLNGKIGMFGSGNKFALAYLLRNAYDLQIYAGTEEIIIDVENQKFRDAEFGVITVNGKQTSITTEFGKDWKLWQALRELYCNAKDEEGAKMEFVNTIAPVKGETHFYITTREEIISFIGKFNEYFSEKRKVVFECEYGKILEKTSDKFCLFRMGINCFNSQKESLYDYDLSSISIDENRLVSYSWEVPSKIWSLIYQCTDKEVIRNVIFNCADTKYIECISSDFASVSSSLMSNEYIEVLKEIQLAPKGLSGLLSAEEIASTVVLPRYLFDQARVVVDNNNLASKFKVYGGHFYNEIDLSSINEAILNKAYDFFKECSYEDPLQHEVQAAIFEDKKVLGFADMETKKIVLSENCFSKGVQAVIETLIEEHVHLKYEVKDETRSFQDAVISEFVTMLKIKNAYVV